MICIELFANAIDTNPDPSDSDQIMTKISWETITCDIFNLDISNNVQAKIFIKLATHFGLTRPNPILNLDLESPDLYRDLNRLLPRETLSEAYYRAGITYLILISENDVAGCYGGLRFLLAFSLSRTSNFRSQSWGRRFVEIQRQLLVGNILLYSLSEGSAREMSVLIDTKIRDGLDPDILTKEINSIVSQSFTHVPQLVAGASQVDFKGLAPIQLIGCALSERTEIPWDTLFERFPILAEELGLTTQYITEIGDDVYAGVKYGGVSQDLKNLLYFCVRALIVIGGEESLRNYAGFGGDNSQMAVPMKVTLDVIIERLKDRQVKLAAEADIDTTDAPISTTNKSNLQKVIQFIKSRNEKKEPDDDDDHDDDSPPGPSGAVMITSFDDQMMDTVHQGDREITSPQPDEDDQTSIISGISGTKRMASSPEATHHPSKRVTRAHTEPESWPALAVNDQGKIDINSMTQVLQSITMTSPPERLKKKVLNQYQWTISDTIKIMLNISVRSDKSYLKPTSEVISVLSQGGSNATVTHYPHSRLKKNASALSIPMVVLVRLIEFNQELLTVGLDRLMLGVICTLIQCGLNGTIIWNLQVISDRSTSDLKVILDSISEINPDQSEFFQDCYLTCGLQKVATLLFDLNTESSG